MCSPGSGSRRRSGPAGKCRHCAHLYADQHTLSSHCHLHCFHAHKTHTPKPEQEEQERSIILLRVCFTDVKKK